MHRYSQDELAFLRDNAPGRTNAELTQMFNEWFKFDLPIEKIERAKANHKISSGLNGRFQKGHMPHNKGVRGVSYPGSERTQFKPGNIPANHQEVGSERINVDGYAEIKTSEPNVWRAKHVALWENINGAVPEGHVVIFGDQNKRNICIQNLILVSRKQLAVVNKNGLLYNDVALTKTGLLIADIHMKCNERKGAKKQCKTS